MKTKSRTRVGLVGLFVLAAVVLMTVAQAAQAASVYGTGTGPGVSFEPTQLQRAHGGFDVPYSLVGSGAVNTLQLPTLAQVRQHQGIAGTSASQVAAAPLTQRLKAHDGFDVPYAVAGSGTSDTAQAPGSSGISSATIWIVAVAVIGALLVGFWALASRRRRQREAAPGCESSLAGC